MEEKYLHFIWKNKRFPSNLLKTITGQEVQIIDVGIHNQHAGPDFFNGKIRIDDSILVGNIEMHVKSSDWNLHKHQFDPAYSNVILHVVYKYDELIFVEGIPLPTIELFEHIDWTHYNQFLKFYANQQQIPCQNQLNDCPSPVFWHQVERAIFQRLERKASSVKSDSVAIAKTLFHFIAKGFGLRTNELPFEELANRIPFERFIRISRSAKTALTFGLAGFLEQEHFDEYPKQVRKEWHFQKARFNLTSGRADSWKFKGCRPSGFPTIRLAQFANFAHEFDWSIDFWELKTEEIIQILIQKLTKEPDPYWFTHYHFDTPSNFKHSATLSVPTAQTIIINSVVPFLWWLADQVQEQLYREKAIEILESLPAEKNAKLDYWKSLNIVPKTAADSQGLLELMDFFCKQKKCLHCEVGATLLKQKR